MALNGVTFDKRVVKAPDDGIVRKVFAGKDGILYGLGITYSGLNVTLAQGYFLATGKEVNNDADLTLPITTAVDGYARLRFWIDLTIAASKTENTQSGFVWDFSESGTFDALVQGDLYGGDDVYELEFCVVQVSSLVVSGITRQLGQIRSTNTRVVYATLDADSWSGAGPYTQDVVVTGMTADGIASVGLDMDATSAEITAAQGASLLVTAQAADEITVSAFGTEPAVDIPIQIVIQG